MRDVVLDSSALLAHLQGEPAGARVREALATARSTGRSLLINMVSVGEVYYLTVRRRGIEAAETFLRHLPTLPLRIVQNGYEEVLEAARVKARHAIPYADAFVVATALRRNAVVMTGDSDFCPVASLIKISRLSAR